MLDRDDSVWRLGGRGIKEADGWNGGVGQVGCIQRGCLLYLFLKSESATIYGAADGIVASEPTM